MVFLFFEMSSISDYHFEPQIFADITDPKKEKALTHSNLARICDHQRKSAAKILETHLPFTLAC